jgi:DNA-binding response OmpR family regulator
MISIRSCQKILIVEDEGDLCLILEMILHRKDVMIDFVKNIAAAKEYVKRSAPDLILLDNRLPDGLGIDFIPLARHLHPEVKIIMISAKAGAVKELALYNGADLFLKKPFSRLELLRCVDSLLDPLYDFAG